MKLNQQPDTGGFTLIEAIVGVMVMGVMLTSLYARMIAQGLANFRVARKARRARRQ
jgi:prepilin-type N-terminal cleavage/methylation domain-containing protein